MLVTIFADASFCPKTFAAGWAAWIKSERGTYRGDGAMKTIVPDNNLAELYAVINAIKLAFVSEVAVAGDTLLVEADNHRALAILANRGKNLTILEKKAATLLNGLRSTYDFTIKPRHVKAHCGTAVPRTWVHDDCDKRAKARMQEAREKLVPPTGFEPVP